MVVMTYCLTGLLRLGQELHLCGIRRIHLLSALHGGVERFFKQVDKSASSTVIQNVWDHPTTPLVGALYAAYVDLRVSDDELANVS